MPLCAKTSGRRAGTKSCTDAGSSRPRALQKAPSRHVLGHDRDSPSYSRRCSLCVAAILGQTNLIRDEAPRGGREKLSENRVGVRLGAFSANANDNEGEASADGEGC